MQIFFSKNFKQQLKKLKKKFPNIKNDLLEKLSWLNFENEIYIGKSIYTIRIKSSDQNKGKSGGFRVYIYFYIRKNLLVPLCIYSKSDKENISENELQYYFDQTIEEMLQRFLL
ncbi:hypothetical protein A2335_03630 [Candidatus Peregrinibacteria bacterium RIFOXYB2_FULL_32_7]|nr:MAG: hypothetical protein A2335_03630 [Candidatus Peregrinibacteria bacterium RIFOXYB2_FULL_32_7]